MEDAQVGSVAEACLSRGSDRSRSWTEARSAAPISLVAISTANSAGSASAAHAERVNAAAELLAADVPVAAAARGLAERFGVARAGRHCRRTPELLMTLSWSTRANSSRSSRSRGESPDWGDRSADAARRLPAGDWAGNRLPSPGRSTLCDAELRRQHGDGGVHRHRRVNRSGKWYLDEPRTGLYVGLTRGGRMKAVVVRQWSGSESLTVETVPDPVADERDVVVELRASALRCRRRSAGPTR